MTKENAPTPEDSAKKRAAVENQSNGEPPPLSSIHGTDKPASAANQNAHSPLQSRQLSHAEKPNDLPLRPTLRIASNQKSDHHRTQEQQQQQQQQQLHISNDTDPTSRTTVSSSSHSKPPPRSVTTTTSVISQPDSSNSESISGNPNHHAPNIAEQHPHGETNNASMLVSSQAVDATESDAAARGADGDCLSFPIFAAATPTGSASDTLRDEAFGTRQSDSVQAHSSTNTSEMYRMEGGIAADNFTTASPTGSAPGTLNDAVLGTPPSDSLQPHSSNTPEFFRMEQGESVTYQRALDAAAQSTIPPTSQDSVPFPSPNASVAGSTSSAHQGNPVECFTEAHTAHPDGDPVDPNAAARCARSLGQEPNCDPWQLADGNNLTNGAAIQQENTGLGVVEQESELCQVSTMPVSSTDFAVPTSRNSLFVNASDSRNAVGPPSRDSQPPDDHCFPALMSIDSGASHCSDQASADSASKEAPFLLNSTRVDTTVEISLNRSDMGKNGIAAQNTLDTFCADESSSTNRVGTPNGEPQPTDRACTAPLTLTLVDAAALGLGRASTSSNGRRSFRALDPNARYEAAIQSRRNTTIDIRNKIKENRLRQRHMARLQLAPQLADGNNLTNVAAIQQESTSLCVVDQGDAQCLVSTTLASSTDFAAPTSRNSLFVNASGFRNAVGTPSRDSQPLDDHCPPALKSIDSGASHCSDQASANQAFNETIFLPTTSVDMTVEISLNRSNTGKNDADFSIGIVDYQKEANQRSSHLPSGGSSTTPTSDDHESKEDASDVFGMDGYVPKK